MPAPSQLTRSELADLVNSLITDPLNQQVTPARVREVLNAITASVYSRADDLLPAGRIQGLSQLVRSFIPAPFTTTTPALLL
ncbi:hypothetical protein, partial [Hymenobacter lapidiphilus]